MLYQVSEVIRTTNKSMNKLSFKKFLIVSICLSFLTPIAYSLELSLESNKAESGTVGYVDIDLVFKKCSLTNQQRDSFKERIKEKEAFINNKKKTLFSLKADISQLKQEKEFALRLPLLLENQKMLNQLSASSSTLAAIPPDPSTTTVLADGLQNTEVVASTQAQATEIETSSPAIKTEPEKPVIDMPGISNVPLDYFKFSVSTSAAIIEEAINKKITELEKARKEISIYRSQAESELLDYESRQTETILGKIYVILKELAIKEGVSVVIDKRSILFGNYAVDLTDKLLIELEKESL